MPEIGQLTLVIGGARSGKSTFAERLASSHGEAVLYVATATAGDPGMSARIAVHQARRPPAWQTIEAPTRVGQLLRQHGAAVDCVLIDSITLLVSNILVASQGHDEALTLEVAMQEIEELIEGAAGLPVPSILVSDEVGLGIVPANPLARAFRDALGLANQRIAAAASATYWVVAGIPVDLRRIQAEFEG